MKQQITYINLIRVVACFFVVAIHCSPWIFKDEVRGLDSLFIFGLMLLIGVGVPLFFMISGALLLPARQDPATFYKRRIFRVLGPLLIWGVIYAWMPYFLNQQDALASLKETILVPIKTPHEGAVLWYLFVLIGLYLLTPFLSAVIESKQNEKIFLSIWLLCTLYGLIDIYIMNSFGKSMASTTTTVTYFSGYIGFYILGHYMHHYSPAFSKRNMVRAVCLLVLSMLTWGIGKFFFYNTYTISSFFIGAIGVAVSTYWILKNIRVTNRSILKIIDFLSPLTFGIYLSQLIIINFVTCRLYEVSTSIPMQVTMIVSTFLLSTVLTWLISKLPFSKYIIG